MKRFFALTLMVLVIAGCNGAPGNENGTQQTQTQNESRQIQVFYIALEGTGGTGETIGCNDRVAPVTVLIDTTPTLAIAFEALILDPRAAPGLHNALANSNLTLDSAVIENGTATVKLSGQLSLGGVCDHPRVEAQLKETALQFPSVEKVEIFINDKPLAEVLSLK